MATVIVDVPTEKIRPFLNLINQLGLDKNSISSRNAATKSSGSSKNYKGFFEKFSPKFLLFDWEFFNNELEFE